MNWVENYTWRGEKKDTKPKKNQKVSFLKKKKIYTHSRVSSILVNYDDLNSLFQKQAPETMEDKSEGNSFVSLPKCATSHLSKVDTTKFLIFLSTAMTCLPGGGRESSLHKKSDQEIANLGNCTPGSNKSF